MCREIARSRAPRDTGARARACYSNLFVLASFMFFKSLLSSIHPSVPSFLPSFLPSAPSPPVDFRAGRGPSKSRGESAESIWGRKTRSFFTFLGH